MSKIDEVRHSKVQDCLTSTLIAAKLIGFVSHGENSLGEAWIEAVMEFGVRGGTDQAIEGSSKPSRDQGVP